VTWLRFLPYIIAAALTAIVSLAVASWWYGRKLEAQESEFKQAIQDVAEIERKTCADNAALTKEASDAYVKSIQGGCGRAAALTKRVWSTATCGDLSQQTKASGDNRTGVFLGLDREQVAELIELARRCDTNTAAAIALDKAW
jgi:hypothetical protein